MPEDRLRGLALSVGPALVLFLSATAGFGAGAQTGGIREFWSPYYRIHYEPGSKIITVNLIGHQQMVSRQIAVPRVRACRTCSIATPGGKPFGQVLIIGAGSGNDVSRALAVGRRARRRRRDRSRHPAARQAAIIPTSPTTIRASSCTSTTAATILQSSNKQYDLIIYALVDSLVLHSSYSNIRLESYLFTQQAFEDVKQAPEAGRRVRHVQLLPPGLDRLAAARHARSRRSAPTARWSSTCRAATRSSPTRCCFGDFTVLIAGATGAASRTPSRSSRSTGSQRPRARRRTPNGFECPTAGARGLARAPGRRAREERGMQFRPDARSIAGNEPQRLATDDWPFLYLRQPMIPSLSLRGMAHHGHARSAAAAPFLRRPRTAARGARIRLAGADVLPRRRASCWSRPRPSSTWRCSSAARGSSTRWCSSPCW